MNVVKNEIVKELSKKYNKDEETIIFMLEFAMYKKYDLKDSIKLIEDFYAINAIKNAVQE